MDKDSKKVIQRIPKEVLYVLDTLIDAGFEACLVGGCVRDLLMSDMILQEGPNSKSNQKDTAAVKDREPKDWDVATNAKPEQIIKLFEKTVYENSFGTVGVYILIKKDKKEVSHETEISDVIHETSNYVVVEVTPYRIEAKYTDFRHPDAVVFGDKLEEDLKRRDFTINSMSFIKNTEDFILKDIFNGQKDIKDRIVRAVGEPDERFQEDALRMLRAVRFACQLNFSVSHETSESILRKSDLIQRISQERIRDELVKIIMSPNPAIGIGMLQKFNLLKHIIPELEEGIRCEQLGEHVYDVWEHLLHALQHAADKNWPLEVRLAALFHDIGKPRTRRFDALKAGGKGKYTFYGHEVVGSRMARKIMERLRFGKKETELVEKLVRNHMFFSDTELITLSAVRRIITRVGAENIWLLMNVRECDRVGMKKKEAPYRLRKYFAMIEQALRDPISVRQLKINGEFMIGELGIKPGPRMGWILNALFEEVLDAPEKNTVEYLSQLAKSLDMLGDAELKVLGERGQEKKEELEEKEIEKLHSKHGVRKEN